MPGAVRSKVETPKRYWPSQGSAPLRFEHCTDAEQTLLDTVDVDARRYLLWLSDQTTPRWSIVWLYARWVTMGRPLPQAGHCARCDCHAPFRTVLDPDGAVWCPSCCQDRDGGKESATTTRMC